jgi:hypothetical protein
VGYVDDNETPEMIMKKFEELERLQHAKDDATTKPSEEIAKPEPPVPSCAEPLSVVTENPALVNVVDDAMDIDAIQSESKREDRVLPLNENQLEELFRLTSSIPAIDGNLDMSMMLGEDADAVIDEDKEYMMSEELYKPF